MKSGRKLERKSGCMCMMKCVKNKTYASDRVWDQIWGQVRLRVVDRVWNQVGDQIWELVWHRIKQCLRDEID